MNKLTATGLIYEMAKGKSIIAIVRDRRRALEVVAGSDLLPCHPGVRVTRTNGNESISIASAKLWFVSPRQGDGLRGRSAHLLFIDSDVEVTSDLMAAASPVVAAIAGGEIIRA